MMTDWEVLKIQETQNMNEVGRALKAAVKDISLQTQPDEFFNKIEAYHRILEKNKSKNEDKVVHFPWGTNSIFEEYKNKGERLDFIEEISPDELVRKFKEIYENKNLRFNYFAWNSVIKDVLNMQGVDVSLYSLVVVNFISEHPYVKSDVLKELFFAFKLNDLFHNEDWKDRIKENPNYAYAEQVLSSGHFELNLFISALPLEDYSLDQIDFLYSRLRQSLHYSSQKKYIPAFNILAEITPELSPLVLLQRKLNIINTAIIQTGNEVAKNNIFPNELIKALQIHPTDPHILFLKAGYIFSYYEKDKVAGMLEDIIKIDPTNIKILALLARQYMKLNLISAARIILNKIVLLEPLNIQYSAYQAKVSRMFIDEKMNLEKGDRNFLYYRDLVCDLVELNLYEEISLLKNELKEETDDLKALFLYAKHHEAINYGLDAETFLADSLGLAKDLDLQLKIKKKILSSIQTKDWKENEVFVKNCFNEFPDDDITNYCMGEVLSLVHKNYKQAMIHFDKVIAVNPRFANVYFARGRNAEVLELYEEAVQNMRTYISHVTHYPVAYQILGNCYFGLKKYYQSYSCYEEGISISGVNNSSCHLQRSLMSSLWHIYEYGDDFESRFCTDYLFKEGLALFDSLNKKDLFANPTVGLDTYYWAAKICHAFSKYELGLKFCQNAAEIYKAAQKPYVPIYLVELSSTFYNMTDKPSEGIDFLVPFLQNDKIAKTDLIMEVVYRRLAEMYMEMKMYDKSFEFNMKTIQFYMTQKDEEKLLSYIYSTFFYYLDRNEKDKILELGNLYLQQIPDEISYQHIVIYSTFGSIYQERGNPQTAIEYYKKCVECGELFPEDYTEMVDEAKNYLLQNEGSKK